MASLAIVSSLVVSEDGTDDDEWDQLPGTRAGGTQSRVVGNIPTVEVSPDGQAVGGGPTGLVGGVSVVTSGSPSGRVLDALADCSRGRKGNRIRTSRSATDSEPLSKDDFRSVGTSDSVSPVGAPEGLSASRSRSESSSPAAAMTMRSRRGPDLFPPPLSQQRCLV